MPIKKYKYPPVKEVIENLKNNMTLKEQSKKYNIPYTSFIHYFNKNTSLNAKNLCERSNTSKNIKFKEFKHLSRKDYLLKVLEKINFFTLYWVDNLSLVEIASKNNLSVDTLLFWIKNYGIIRKRDLRSIRLKKAIELGDSISRKELSNLLNISIMDTANLISHHKKDFYKGIPKSSRNIYEYPPMEEVIANLKNNISLYKQTKMYNIPYGAFKYFFRKTGLKVRDLC